MSTQPRFELLDQAGEVLAMAPLTDDVLQEADTDGAVKQNPLNMRVTARGKATSWRSVNARGETRIGPVVKIEPNETIALPLYLSRIDLEAGEILTGHFQSTTVKDAKETSHDGSNTANDAR